MEAEAIAVIMTMAMLGRRCDGDVECRRRGLHLEFETDRITIIATQITI